MIANDPKQPTLEQLEKHFSAMHDSINLINALNEKTMLSETEKDELKRNKEHLTIMLGKDFISADSRDKKVFIDATK